MAKNIAYLGIMSALACIMSYIESLIPFFVGVPGIKLGLANVIIVFVLYTAGGASAGIVSMIRICLVSAMFGNMAAFLYSLTGALCSLCIMIFLKKTKASVYGVSVAGAIAHNIGQLLTAMAVLKTVGVWSYFPVLLVAAVLTGIIIAWIVKELQKRIRFFLSK